MSRASRGRGKYRRERLAVFAGWGQGKIGNFSFSGKEFVSFFAQGEMRGEIKGSRCYNSLVNFQEENLSSLNYKKGVLKRGEKKKGGEGGKREILRAQKRLCL